MGLSLALPCYRRYSESFGEVIGQIPISWASPNKKHCRLLQCFSLQADEFINGLPERIVEYELSQWNLAGFGPRIFGSFSDGNHGAHHMVIR